MKDISILVMNALMQNLIVTRQESWHLFRMFLREFGTAFDICEEEGDCAGRECFHAGSIQKTEGSFKKESNPTEPRRAPSDLY